MVPAKLPDSSAGAIKGSHRQDLRNVLGGLGQKSGLTIDRKIGGIDSGNTVTFQRLLASLTTGRQ